MPAVRAAALLVLAGCAAAPAPEAVNDAAVAACAAAVAEHVGTDASRVSAAWSGVGVVTVTDTAGTGGERLHTCDVDATGRVLAIRHPGA